MGDYIKHLPGAVHSSVRSGIILFDIATVVEELVFNSLDAGATKIYVGIGSGTFYVKVTDNGCGITRDGLVLLGERYVTSKSDQLGDTNAVSRSFGFRGEALSSIADISLLEVITKAHGMPNGYRKVMKGCKCVYLGIDDGRKDVGTTVIVRDLFYNQPVRRKHAQSSGSTKKLLQSVRKCVTRIALVHPKVLFKVLDVESEDELFCTYPSNSPLSLLISSFGIEDSSSLHELNVSEGVLKLSGYTSNPRITSSSKVFQYVYINSRYISKGPIHKLLNQVAFRFNTLDLWKGSRVSQNSRSGSQVHATYLLNLSCPRLWYDLSFEPSKTRVEFKDWVPIIRFVEETIAGFWREMLPCDPFICGTDALQGDNMSREADYTSLQEKDLLAKQKSRFADPIASFGLPSRTLKMQADVGHHVSYHRDEQFSASNDMGFDDPRNELQFVHETNYSCPLSDELVSPSWATVDWERHDYLQSSDGDAFSANAHTDYTLRSGLASGSLKVDASISNRHKENGTLSNCFHSGNNMDKKFREPFMRSCSSKRSMPLDGDLANFDEFRCHIGGKTKRKKTEPYNVVDVGDVDDGFRFDFMEGVPHQDEAASPQSLLRPRTTGSAFQIGSPSDKAMKRKPDNFVDFYGDDERFDLFQDEVTVAQPVRSLTNYDVLDGLDSPFVDSLKQSAISGVSSARECETVRGSVAQSGALDSASWSFGSVESSVLPDSLFVTKSHMKNQFFDEENGLERGIHYDTSVGYDYFASSENKDDIFHTDNSSRNATRRENSFLSSWGNSSTCLKDYACSEDALRLQLHHLDDDLFPECSDANNKGADWSHLHSCGMYNSTGRGIGSNKASSSICNEKDANRTDHTLYQEERHVCQTRPRRSHSAPPFFRGKKKFLALSNHLARESEACEFKHLGRTSGVHQLQPESNLGVSNSPNKKKTQETDEIQRSKMHEKPESFIFKNARDTRGVKKIEVRNKPESQHICKMDVAEGNSEVHDSVDSAQKWRRSCKDTAKVDKIHNRNNEEAILSISSGILHLAGDSFVPQSIERSFLENAQVLQQVDKKFIPVVGNGVLAIIDQHAADERIRLEELREKVLSGEKKTITYLDDEQELVLPEIGYQLLHSYADRIRNWGWICNDPCPDSRSFKRNLNILHKQPTDIKLIAVPCILGVNLTDVDLLEFLQQLADTDGSSSIPPAVHRVLNSKACRGAIMFGDSLLPSECSLIVEELKKTSLCFQCAHGRPTTVPIVNLEALHKHIRKLPSSTGSGALSEPWHGLHRYEISLERAANRLRSAKGEC